MNKSQFRKFVSTSEHQARQVVINHLPSVTDPTFARTGRQMATDPLPIEYKPIYRNGVTIDHMQAFDKMYVDKISGFNSAKEFNDQTLKDLKDAKTKYDADVSATT